MSELFVIWIVWVLSCMFLVLFGLATPLFKTYDLWVGFFWDGERKLLYIFPIPMIGCVMYLGGREEAKIVRRYIVEIPPRLGEELVSVAEKEGKTTIELVKSFVTTGLLIHYAHYSEENPSILVIRELNTGEETEVTLDD